MDQTDAPSLLERKIAAHRPRVAPAAFSAEGALFTALARAAERACQLPLRLTRGEAGLRTGTELVETLPDHVLIALLEGPKETMGLALLDPGMLAALTEVMTLGGLAPAAPAPRRPTRTDAAMMAGLIDAVLAEFDGLIAAEDATVWAGGFRYSAHLADPRPLGLMLDEPAYRTLRLTVGFGGGLPGRDGVLTLVLPARGRGAAPVRPPGEEPAPLAAADDPAWQATLTRTVDSVSAEVHAVLARVTLSLAEVLVMESGHSLPLPAQALSMVQVEGEEGQVLCLASLGQGNGHRALRLSVGEALDSLPVSPSTLIAAHDQPLSRAPSTADRHADHDPLAADLGTDAGEPATTAEATPAPLARTA